MRTRAAVAIVSIFILLLFCMPYLPKHVLASSVYPSTADPSIAVSPSMGPPGAIVTISGSGFQPDATYVLCVTDNPSAFCPYTRLLYWSSGSWSQALSRPGLPDVNGSQLNGGLEFFVPGWENESPGAHSIGVYPTGTSGTETGSPSVASAVFTVTFPTLMLVGSQGPSGVTIVISRSGLLPATEYLYCLGPPANPPPTPAVAKPCGIDSPSFTTDANGTVPSGVTLQIPAGTPSGSYAVHIQQQGSGMDTILVGFALQGTTVTQCYPANTCYPTLFSPIVLYGIVGAVATAAVVLGYLLVRRRGKKVGTSTQPEGASQAASS